MKRSVCELLVRLDLAPDTPADWFDQALTHCSFAAENPQSYDYERLEFLGDAILKFAVARLLFGRYPNDSEGMMTKVLTRVVSDHTLARVARELELADFLRLGVGEVLTGGTQRSSTLASALEAILAAVYLTCGTERACNVVADLLGDEVVRAHQEPGSENFKALLQERAQKELGLIPKYLVLSDTMVTPYEHVFEVAVQLRGKTLYHGRGPNKRGAEQEAARLALIELGWASQSTLR